MIPQHYTAAIADVLTELAAAVSAHAPMGSAHEGYAVILEELDELKEHVWKKATRRDLQAMRAEACQVAAMACRFMAEVCGGE